MEGNTVIEHFIGTYGPPPADCSVCGNALEWFDLRNLWNAYDNLELNDPRFMHFRCYVNTRIRRFTFLGWTPWIREQHQLRLR